MRRPALLGGLLMPMQCSALLLPASRNVAMRTFTRFAGIPLMPRRTLMAAAGAEGQEALDFDNTR